MTRSRRVSALAVVALVLAACQDAPTTSPTLAAPTRPAAFSAQSAPEQVMAGEIVVRLRDDADVAAVAREHGLALGQSGYRNAFVIMHGNAGVEHANADALRGDARVQYAEPNYLREATAVNPNLWAFYNPGSLNMKYSSGRTKGAPLPSSYASTLDADEDNIEGYATGGGDVCLEAQDGARGVHASMCGMGNAHPYDAGGRPAN